MNTPLLTDREENMAPWNQKEPKPIKVTASITLSKTFDILVNVPNNDEEVSESTLREAAQEYIEDYLAENFGINSPETQAKTLEAISISIKYKNGLLGEDEIEKINREKERMEKAFE